MKRAMLRAAYVIAFIAASIFGGWWLGKLISQFSFEMPDWLATTIETAMYGAGATDPLDPEDIETFGLMALFLACCIGGAIVLAIALWGWRQYRKKRRAP
jgi:hypothetical protein